MPSSSISDRRMRDTATAKTRTRGMDCMSERLINDGDADHGGNMVGDLPASYDCSIPSKSSLALSSRPVMSYLCKLVRSRENTHTDTASCFADASSRAHLRTIQASAFLR
jgi:hypothetical protein